MAVRKYYDRYGEFKSNGKYKFIPFLKIPRKATDLTVVYKSDTRLDIISDDYYNNPNFGWLILQANPEYGGMEFDIPNNTTLRLPFPLLPSLNDFDKVLTRYRKINGI